MLRKASPTSVGIVLSLAALLGASCLADTVRLKSSVRLTSGAERIHLSDIADLQGPDAESFADLVIDEILDSTAPQEIPVRLVRAKLDEAGAHWGRVNLSGNKVIVRPRPAAKATAPEAMAGASLVSERRRSSAASSDNTGTDDLNAETIIEETTLRGAIARYMARALDITPDSLRLLFEHDDAEFLGAQDQTYRFELTPESSAASDRVTLTVRAWSDGAVARSGQITFRPLMHTPVAVLVRDLVRDEMIAAQDFQMQWQWLSPVQASVTTDPECAAGRLASKKLRTNDALRNKHVKRQTLIERGDRVTVRCLVGGVVISLQAEACDDGAEGQAIDFRKLGERKTFAATVTERGEAIVNLGR